MVRAAAPDARAVVGDIVLRRSRQPRRTQAPRAVAARGPRAVPRYAAVARAADAERRDARAEDPQPAAVQSYGPSQRAAEPDVEARLASRSRVQAVRAPRRAHVRRRPDRRDRRLLEDIGIPARGGALADA